jgi:hypothetical protein
MEAQISLLQTALRLKEVVFGLSTACRDGLHGPSVRVETPAASRHFASPLSVVRTSERHALVGSALTKGATR